MDKEYKGIAVYYNSACSICNAGIAYQKKRMAGCEVHWRDVHANEQACREIAAERELVRERLHAIDEQGQIRVGVEAFETIWRHSPNERWKAHLLALPMVRPVAIALYNAFARGLYRWNRWQQRW